MWEWKISIEWVRVAEAMASEMKKRTESLRRNEWMSRVHWNQCYFPAFVWSRGAPPMNEPRTVNFMQRSFVFFIFFDSRALLSLWHLGGAESVSAFGLRLLSMWNGRFSCSVFGEACSTRKIDENTKNFVPCPTITPPSPPSPFPRQRK